MSRTDAPVPLTDVRCALGEGPTWDAAAGLLRWVDIEAGRVWAAPTLAEDSVDDAPRSEDRPETSPDGGVLGVRLGAAVVVYDAGPLLGAAVPAAGGAGLVLAHNRALVHVDPTGVVVGRLPLVPDGVASRLNDAVCDPAGRLVVGSMALDDRTGRERLWRLEADGTATVLDDDLTLSNGLGWSPDGGTFYSVDSIDRALYARDYAPATGRTGPRRVLARIDDATPDGLTVDAEGTIWLALWGGGAVRALSPEGRVLGEIATGAPLTTCCAFVGPHLDVLVVTSAGHDEPGLTQTDVAGLVLGVRPGVVGRATTLWEPVPLPG